MISKRKIGLVLLGFLVLMFAACLPVSASDSSIKIFINGIAVDDDAAPIIENGLTLVPLRLVAEGLNAKVSWYADDGRVEVRRGLRFIELWVPKGSYRRNYAYVNGRYMDLDVSPRVIKGRTYVPLRLISEGLGAKVSWDRNTRTVSVEISPIKNLEGMSAGVRDAVYNTIMADSYRINSDAQLRIPDYPQLNIINAAGEIDSNGNWYMKGHAGGWFFEAVELDSNYFIKSALFNNEWVGLPELVGKETAEEIQREKEEAEKAYKESAYDYVTEIIRGLGQPIVAAEENINGVMCQKIIFKPTEESLREFMEAKRLDEDFEGLSVTLWIGKTDNLVYKSDFRVDFTTYGISSDSKGKGFIRVTANISDINANFKVQTPSDLAKKKNATIK